MLRGAMEELEAGSIEGGGVLLATEVLDDDFLLLSLIVPLVLARLRIAVGVKVGALAIGWRYIETEFGFGRGGHGWRLGGDTSHRTFYDPAFAYVACLLENQMDD